MAMATKANIGLISATRYCSKANIPVRFPVRLERTRSTVSRGCFGHRGVQCAGASSDRLAGGDENRETPKGGAQAASEMVANALKASMDKDLESLLLLAPDSFDEPEEKPPRGFFVDSQMAQFESLVKVDAYARRALLFGAPQEVQVLSSMMLNPVDFRQRVQVTLPSGEESVLTFQLGVQEEVVPQFRSIGVHNRWTLTAIRGESSRGEFPTAPAPWQSPELVVEAQLRALQTNDVATVFSFASPSNKAATGPLSKFTEMLKSPLYDSLFNIEDYQMIRDIQIAPTRFVQLVGVQTKDAKSEEGKPVSIIFAWGLGLQEDDGPCKGCWMTDSVQPVGESNSFMDWPPL